MKKIKILKILEKICLILETDLIGFQCGMMAVACHFDLVLPGYWSIICASIFTALVVAEIVFSCVCDKLVSKEDGKESN